MRELTPKAECERLLSACSTRPAPRAACPQATEPEPKSQRSGGTVRWTVSAPNIGYANVQKDFGRYYTPPDVALSLARWAIGDKPCRVLDPSYGTCNFLIGALIALTSLGADDAKLSVYGVDIDAHARIHSHELRAMGVPESNLIEADFFDCPPPAIGDKFPVIVGNPPYVRHHRFSTETASKIRRCAHQLGARLSGRADMWAAFTIWATAFLTDGGRMAFVLPGAVMHADYAQDVWRYLMPRFSHLTTIRLNERLFPDASEESVLLLLEGHKLGAARGRVHMEVEGREDLHTVLQQWHFSTRPLIHNCDRQGGRDTQALAKLQTLNSSAAQLMSELSAHKDVATLGSIAHVKIGVVTGANKVFVRSTDSARTLDAAGACSVPILDRSAALRHPVFHPRDQGQREVEGYSSRLLVVAPGTRLTPELERVVRDAEAQGVHERAKCLIRSPWWALSDVSACDAFLPYMGSRPPRLVLNLAGATGTNSIHRVSWRDSTVGDIGVVGSWTSLAALCGEIVGRHYGGGVLKLEIHEARQMMLPMVPKTTGLAIDLDKMSRGFNTKQVTNFVDNLVLGEGLGLSSGDVALLRDAAQDLRQRRKGWRAPLS